MLPSILMLLDWAASGVTEAELLIGKATHTRSGIVGVAQYARSSIVGTATESRTGIVGTAEVRRNE